MNLESSECSEMLETIPPIGCQFHKYTEWPDIAPSCKKTRSTTLRTKPTRRSRKTRSAREKQLCCSEKSAFLDSGIVVDGKLNKTAMSTWFGTDGDPQIMENIEQCEAIGSKNFYKRVIPK